MSIEFRHLRYVIAAAEEGSFRWAAIALGVQESAISRRIRDLEDNVGVALFERHYSGVELTYAGRRFLNRARKAMNQIGQAALDAGCAGRAEDGLIRIGILTSLAGGFLADLLRAYRSSHPGIRLELREAGPAYLTTGVVQRDLDVAFVPGVGAVRGCHAVHLWRERLFVALPADHPLAKRQMIRWERLREEHFVVTEADPGPEIHTYLISHLARARAKPSIERCAVYRDNLMQLIALGRGLTVVTEAMTQAATAGVVFRELRADPLPFSALWSNGNQNPALTCLLSLARQRAAI